MGCVVWQLVLLIAAAKFWAAVAGVVLSVKVPAVELVHRFAAPPKPGIGFGVTAKAPEFVVKVTLAPVLLVTVTIFAASVAVTLAFAPPTLKKHGPPAGNPHWLGVSLIAASRFWASCVVVPP
jgi:lipoprotein signal peptidase